MERWVCVHACDARERRRGVSHLTRVKVITKERRRNGRERGRKRERAAFCAGRGVRSNVRVEASQRRCTDHRERCASKTLRSAAPTHRERRTKSLWHMITAARARTPHNIMSLWFHQRAFFPPPRAFAKKRAKGRAREAKC